MNQYADFVIPFGKYKKKKTLSELPEDYLMQLYKDKLVMSKYPEIKMFVSDIVEIKKQEERERYFKRMQPICRKICFATEQIAKSELRRIKSMEQSHTKPYRIYECPDCGGWHLTSKEYIKWDGEHINNKKKL